MATRHRSDDGASTGSIQLCVIVVLVAFGYFAAWQVGVAMTLIGIGVYVWWRGRQPRPGRDSLA